MPMCCMDFTEMANDTSKEAGYWGAYFCDTPVWTFEDMLKHIQEQYSSVSIRIPHVVPSNPTFIHKNIIALKNYNRKYFIRK